MNMKQGKTDIIWLSLKEAAALVWISPRQLTQRAEQGEIAHKREGQKGRGRRGVFLFARSDVEAYNSRKRIPARYELEVPKCTVPTIWTRMFIDPNDCNHSNE
jgi:hypothetical protein